MDETVELDDDLQQHVTDVMEQFERDTELIFRKFYQKCDQSGYHIEREQFMNLVTERMGKAFDEFRSELEEREAKQKRDVQSINENFQKEVTELAEATKTLIKQKECDKFDPMHSERRQKFLDFIDQCTSNMFSKNDSASNTGGTANHRGHGTDSMYVSMEMSSPSAAAATHKMFKTKRRQMVARAKKQCGKGTKVTVTRVTEQANGVRRQMIITKHKSTTISISGVTFERSSSAEDDPTADDDNINADADNINETDTKIETKRESSAVSEFIKYRCVHCHDVKHWIETFHALKDVYAHWCSSHTDLADIKPFQYYIVENVSCYHCSAVGTHYELVKHHKCSHPSMTFAIVSQNDRAQCALCPYSGIGIIAHFQTMHKFVLKTLSVRQLRCIDIPFRLNNTQLDAHLNQKLHKKQKCGCCNAIFDTDREVREHHGKMHKSLKMTIKEFDNNNIQLICNCCNIKIERHLYLNHIEHCALEFKCHECAFDTNDMIALVKHDKKAHGHNDSFGYRCMQFKNRLKRDFLKTRVIFGNGLVVTRQNLSGTKYDDSKPFQVFIDKLLEIKKERHGWEIKGGK